MSFYYLARFRADPSKVRVSIRRMPNGWWRATVEERDVGQNAIELPFTGMHKLSPVRAVVRALLAADRAQLPGIDLGMGWAYEHPYGELGPNTTKHRGPR